MTINEQYKVAEIKFSAILPNYNMAGLLHKSIQSLLNQKNPFDEIIVVDDGSTDNSVDVINEIKAKHPTVRLICHERNQGVNPALNTGLAAAQGDYILLCAADDTYGVNMVASAKEVIKQHPDIGLVCGDAMVNRFDLAEPFHRTLPYPPNKYIDPVEFTNIASKGFVCFNSGGGTLMNRKAVEAAGCLVNNTRWHGDWLLYFVVAFRQGIFYVKEDYISITMRKESYSEGKRYKDVQDKVIIDTLHAIYTRYPDVWPAFKRAGLLPHFAPRYILLLLSDPIGRRFITARLLWKIILNNKMVVRVGRLFPYRVILGVRKLLRA